MESHGIRIEMNFWKRHENMDVYVNLIKVGCRNFHLQKELFTRTYTIENHGELLSFIVFHGNQSYSSVSLNCRPDYFTIKVFRHRLSVKTGLCVS